MEPTLRPRTLFIVGGALIVLAGTLFLWLIVHEQQRLHNDGLRQRMAAEARLVCLALREQWPDVPRGPLDRIVRSLQREGAHVAVITERGVSLLEDPAAPGVNELLAAPEVVRALRGGSGEAVRRWGPDNRAHVIVAMEVGAARPPPGVVWLARPRWTAREHPAALGRSLGLVAALAVLTTAVFVTALVRVRRRVLRRVIQTARNLSSGDLSSELDVDGADELAVLSSSLNVLRRRLASQLETIDRQRRMLQALVDHLGEGVIVAGTDGRIVMINPAAVRFLNLGEGSASHPALIGRPVEACIRQHPLQRLLLAPLSDYVLDDEAAGSAKLSCDASLCETYLQVQSSSGTVHLLARASELDLAEAVDPSEPAVGRVVVLTDITELERTLEVRSDFVANASHELRTPLSTIRAAVETLLTMDLRADADAAVRFLNKIDRHSDRLEQMVGDLLDLSRLESPTERFEPEPLDVNRLLSELRFRFGEALEAKQLKWETACEPEGLHTLHVNPHLLRLILDNLVDNAIKFSDAGGRVRVRIRRLDGRAAFEVSDDGCGIPREDQQRVFERFYQVQRSRSGVERGTGLGLSIVRHAVGALQGQIELESDPGRGTRVVVTVPQQK